MQELIDSLNPPQREAVEATDGPVLVLAGAGTGKTRVLTSRLANILHKGLAFPNQIMAVTFTNKAAREMAERVEQIAGQPVAGLWLGTFHALGARLLRMHAERVNLEQNFNILDTDDQNRLLDQVLKDMNIDTTQFPPRLAASVISRWKDNGWTVDEVPNEEGEALAGQGVRVYREYQKRLEALNAADFGDLLLKSLTLFKNNPDLLERYQNQFKYVLVDEYQDTNAVQYMWLRLLVMGHKNICVVGDDDQSIYAWRGALVGNILRFEQDFPGAKVIRLEQNYRSTGTILKAASGLISHNSERHGKTLWTEDVEGDLIEIHPVMDDREEARLIADQIDRHIGKGGRYDNCAVLVRTAAQTRGIEEKFVQSGVPYQMMGGLRFYERKEIRDALAYLRLVHDERDSLAFERIINVPKRGIGASTVKSVADYGRAHNMPSLTAARSGVDDGWLSTRVTGNLRPFLAHIDRWRELLEQATPDALMETILEESGYMDMLRDSKEADAKGRIENLKELVRALQEYADVTAFLEHVSLVMDREEELEDAVKIATVHAAKGLEFDIVYLPGFEDGLFPHQRSLNEEGEKGIEEERRLAYVAITRARKRLVISYAASRRMYGSFQPCAASRFLEEIPEECTKVVSGFSPSSFRPQAGSSMDRRGSGDWGKRSEPLMASKPIKVEREDGFNVGTRVFHQKFGYGKVAKAEGNGEMARLTINFDKAGQKKLVAGLANLQVA